ncbi:hypothetical protein HDK77DRAFT_191505 [Phyllosticta capitalensis]|uniref:uncharacterized protein n=1 Tax=Phyllosticta capitalensis TaxID=121624 RepID=UPI003130DB63
MCGCKADPLQPGDGQGTWKKGARARASSQPRRPALLLAALETSVISAVMFASPVVHALRKSTMLGHSADRDLGLLQLRQTRRAGASPYGLAGGAATYPALPSLTNGPHVACLTLFPVKPPSLSGLEAIENVTLINSGYLAQCRSAPLPLAGGPGSGRRLAAEPSVVGISMPVGMARRSSRSCTSGPGGKPAREGFVVRLEPGRCQNIKLSPYPQVVPKAVVVRI